MKKIMGFVSTPGKGDAFREKVTTASNLNLLVIHSHKDSEKTPRTYLPA